MYLSLIHFFVKCYSWCNLHYTWVIYTCIICCGSVYLLCPWVRVRYLHFVANLWSRGSFCIFMIILLKRYAEIMEKFGGFTVIIAIIYSWTFFTYTFFKGWVRDHSRFFSLKIKTLWNMVFRKEILQNIGSIYITVKSAFKISHKFQLYLRILANIWVINLWE